MRAYGGDVIECEGEHVCGVGFEWRIYGFTVISVISVISVFSVMQGWMDARMQGCKDGWMQGCKDARMDGVRK